LQIEKIEVAKLDEYNVHMETFLIWLTILSLHLLLGHTKPTVTSALNMKFTVLVGDTFAYRLPTMNPETRFASHIQHMYFVI